MKKAAITDGGRLLDDADPELLVAGLVGQLLEPDGGRHARRAAAHDDDVGLVAVALHLHARPAGVVLPRPEERGRRRN